MNVVERLQWCRLIEKIEKNQVYAKRLGVSNVSGFREKNKESYIEKKKEW